MTEENDKYDSVYNQLSEITPPRGDVDDGNGELEENFAGTLAQRMKASPKLSDTQVVDKRLFPALREPWLANLMVARVFPDTMNPLRNINIKHLLQEYDEVQMAEAISETEVAVTIPLDGEGRLDIIHMFSRLSEQAQEKEGNKI
jgi:hypothetical protein